MDPMGGVLPSGSPSAAGPADSGPVQRKVAGAGPAGATPQSSFNVAAKQPDDDDDDDGPWYKNREKKKLGIVVALFLLVFIPFGFPSVVSIIDAGWGNKVEGIVKPWKWFGGDNYRSNSTDLVTVDPNSIKILPSGENSSVAYVIGEAKNTSSETFEQVEIKFFLYNSSKEKVGEAVEYKDKMGPNSTWNFKAACTSTDVHSADLMKVIVR